MIGKLGTIGGDNIKQSVRRVMASILNNDVAKKNELARERRKKGLFNLTFERCSAPYCEEKSVL